MSRANWSDLFGKITGETQLALAFAGVEFDFEWIVEAVPATTGTAYLRITNTGGKYVVVNFRQLQTDQERAFFRIYTDITSATPDGDPLNVNNRRGDATMDSTTVVQKVTAPVFDADSIILNKPVFGAPGALFQPSVGDLQSESDVRILPPGFDVLLEVENNSDDPTYWYAQFKQYEISASAMPGATEI